jgi:hypothetical protein
LSEPVEARPAPSAAVPRSRGLNRRELVALSAAAGVAQSFAGTSALFAAATPPTVRPMSVGFLENSELLRVVRSSAWQAARFERTVLPASELPLGDQQLAGESVRLTVHGFYPALRNLATGGVRSAMLIVNFPSPDPARPAPLPFYAWGFSLRPGVSKGQRVSFDVPLGVVDGGLDLALEVSPTNRGVARALGLLAGAPPEAAVMEATAAQSGRLRFETRFTVDADPGRPKLQRGAYFLGLAADTWSRATTLPGQGSGPRPDLLSLVVSVAPARS